MSRLYGSMAVWLALLLPLAACDLTSVEEIQAQDVIVAEAYLRAGAGAEVFLYRTLPGAGGSLRVDGATVEIAASRSGSRVQLAQTADTGQCASAIGAVPEGEQGSCYTAIYWSHSVQPRETYRLSVTTLDGRELTGTTTVPGDFEIRRPSVATCTLAGERAQIVWTPSEGARSYQLTAGFTDLAEGLEALGVKDPPDELDLVGLAIGRTDTTISFPDEFGVFDRFSLDRDLSVALQQGLPDGASADIVVAAGDENFVNWVRGGNFNPSGPIRVPSIVGDGTGVFGALNIRQVTILSQASGYPSCQ